MSFSGTGGKEDLLWMCGWNQKALKGGRRASLGLGEVEALPTGVEEVDFERG